jgi:CMP-N-acetylneuraminic acid synthetase
MISGKSVLGLIPARGGSKRIPLKNLRHFHGKSLLEIAIQTARQSKYLDLVLVSTDHPQIAHEAARLHCLILPRPPELSTDFATSEFVALHALLHYPHDLLCLLQPTSPCRTAADIDACIEMWPAVSYNDSTSKINGAVYVTGPDCIYDGFHQKYMMPASRSLDIDSEQDLV